MSSAAVSSAVSYARENQKRFLDELKDLLRIPSVSTTEEHKDDVRKAAEMVAADLKRIGSRMSRSSHQGHPLVYGDWLHAAASPPRYAMRTSMCSRPSRWTSGNSAVGADRAQPNIYARGAVDDKGQLWMQMKAYESLFKPAAQAAHQCRVLFEAKKKWRREH